MIDSDSTQHASTRRSAISLLFCVVLAFVLVWQPARDPDLWYHLAAGRWIAEHFSIPTVDTWTFTAAGQRWISHEWLYEIVVYGLFRLGGPAALALFNVALAALTLCLVDDTARRKGVPSWLRCAVLALVAAAAADRLADRPHMVTFLLGALSLGIIEQAFGAAGSEGGMARPRLLWWLVPIAWVWGNCHAGVIYLYAMVGIAMLDYGLTALRRGVPWSTLLRLRDANARRLAFAAFCVFAASLASPNHVWSALYPIVVLSATRAAHFTTLELLGAGPGSAHWLRLLVPACVLLSVLQIRRRPLREALLALALGQYAWRWLRERPFFFLMLAPYYMDMLHRSLRAWTEPLKPRAQRAMLAATGLVLAGAAGVAVIAALPRERNVHLPDPLMPREAMAFHQKHGLPDRVFNPHAWGGAIEWLGNESIRVFLDARLDVFPSPVLAQYLEVMAAGPRWAEILASYDVACCMLDYSEYYGSAPGGPGRGNLRATLFASPDWVLVYWGDDGMIYLRRDFHELQLAPLRAWTVVDPDRRDFDAYAQEGRLKPAIEELQAMLAVQPHCVRARRFLGHLCLRAERFTEAAAAFERVTASNRCAPEDFYALAYAWEQQGDTARAREAAHAGLALAPHDATLRECAQRLNAAAGASSNIRLHGTGPAAAP